MKFGVVLFSRICVSISAVLSTKQSSQAIMKKSGGGVSFQSQGVVSFREEIRGVSFQSQGVVVFEEESRVCSTFFFTPVFLGTNIFTPFTPGITTCESCFLMRLAENGTQILEKRTTPDFKKFSQEKKKMKKQNENKIKKTL